MKSVVMLGLLGVGAIIGGAACSSEDPGSSESEIAIDKATENPAVLLGPTYETTLQKIIPASDKGKRFGLEDSRVPYPDTYWPFLYVDPDSNEVIARNGIDDRWQTKNIPSPLEKFMGLVDPDNMANARAWEKANHGEDVPNVANWFGHCPGWTAAAMFNDPVTHAVSVKRSESGDLVACGAPNEKGCTSFEIGDINALEAEVFLSSTGGFIGARCDTKPVDVKRDANGRIIKAGCRGLNPGALMVVLANRMKNVNDAPNFRPRAVAINAQNESNTDQIWNQPAYRYEVNDARPLSEEEAIQATNKGSALPSKYPFNPAAKGFFRVDIGIKWVTELGPNKKVVSGLDSTETMRFVAVLELDGDPSSPRSTIIGGEFIEDRSVGANRLTVPPFVWTADGLASDRDARNHNPFVAGSLVQKIVKIAQK